MTEEMPDQIMELHLENKDYEGLRNALSYPDLSATYSKYDFYLNKAKELYKSEENISFFKGRIQGSGIIKKEGMFWK